MMVVSQQLKFSTMSDSFLDFTLEQIRLSSRLYPQELREHVNLFHDHVHKAAQITHDLWRRLFESKSAKVENFIKRYHEDLETEFKAIRDSFYYGPMTSTLEHDALRQYPRDTRSGLSREAYYLGRTDDAEAETLDYPHPWLIVVQKRRLCHLVAMQMKTDLANQQVLAEDKEDYVPLGWHETL